MSIFQVKAVISVEAGSVIEAEHTVRVALGESYVNSQIGTWRFDGVTTPDPELKLTIQRLREALIQISKIEDPRSGDRGQIRCARHIAKCTLKEMDALPEQEQAA
ncbi:MAG: hypothetical protein JJ902_05320 [Roseibium sp.]|nr:hypothetical protein [Roseibium sp.]